MYGTSLLPYRKTTKGQQPASLGSATTGVIQAAAPSDLSPGNWLQFTEALTKLDKLKGYLENKASVLSHKRHELHVTSLSYYCA